jgi:hypothetical protein
MLPLLILTLVIIGFFLSCDTTNPPIPEQHITEVESSTHFLWPYQIGSYWEYERYQFVLGDVNKEWEYTDFNSFGFDLDTLQSTSSHILEIVDTMKLALNDTLFPVHIFDFKINNTYTNWRRPYWVGEDGVYSLGISIEQDTLFRKGLYIPSELFDNKTWIGLTTGRQEGRLFVENDTGRCLSINEKIKTLFGDFDCFVLKTRISEADDYPGYLENYKYYAPGIGLVAQVRIFIVPNNYWFLDYVDIIKNFSIKEE